MSDGDAYAAARALVAADLARVEAQLDAMVGDQAAYLGPEERALYRRGKKLRPLLMLLCAHAGSRSPGGALPEHAITAAASLEMVHVGSLIHDDIVDHAETRRGIPTIAAARGYELALVMGDLQWIEATRQMANFVRAESDLALMRKYLDAARALCRGQLDEMIAEPAGDWESLLRRYFRTIDRKTGRLIAFACEGGAQLAPDPVPNVISPLKRYGTLVGRAFQVMDDVLDVVRSSAAAGKEQLIDLARGRLSLAILYTLETLPADHPMQGLLRGETLAPAAIAEAQKLLRYGDGWIRALGDARAMVVKAGINLRLLPESPHRAALQALADHIVNQRFQDSHGTSPNPHRPTKEAPP